MKKQDLRQWISQVEEMGELKRIEDARWDLEIGCLTDENSVRNGPALLFDPIRDYPKGYGVLTSMILSVKRFALTFNMKSKTQDYRQLMTEIEKLIPIWEAEAKNYEISMTPDGPVKENIFRGKEINLYNFPTPKYHEEDGGRYMGTGTLIIMQDPETGLINLGTYRLMIHDESTLTIYASPGKRGNIIMKKYHDQGKPCPVVATMGQHPVLVLAGSAFTSYDLSELNFPGAILEESIECLEGESTGLPIPAFAEVAVEGEIRPDRLEWEGPFGEWTGYYGGGRSKQPVIEVKTLMHRNDPIMVGYSPGRGERYELMFYNSLFNSSMLKSVMERCGIPGIKGVWRHRSGGGRMLTIISISQKYAGHSRQVGHVAAQLPWGGGYMGRYVIVVDDDIDPTNTNDVLWALCTRSDPERDIEITKRNWSSRLDPLVSLKEGAFFNSKAIIDACIPYERLQDFPKALGYNENYRKEVLDKWRKVMGWNE